MKRRQQGVQPPDGKVRGSQMLGAYGPGAMVDLVHDAVLVRGLEGWTPKGSRGIDEPRLRERLQRRFPELSNEAPFRTPPEGDDRDPTRECVCLSMIGMIHQEQGNVEDAINAFIGGLHAAYKTPDQELALTYEVGNAYELRGNGEQALYYFQLVSRVDPRYVDGRGAVADRIARLQPQPRPAAARVSGAESLGDEFDRAFDDLFGKE